MSKLYPRCLRYSYLSTKSPQKSISDMVIKTSWLVLIFGVGIPAVLGSPELSADWISASEIRAHQKERSMQDRLANLHAEQAQNDSGIALARVKSGCVPIIASKTKQDTRLAEGVDATVAGPNSVVLGDGSLVCSKSGDTGEVWDGKITQVKRVGPMDASEYSEYFSKQLGAY